MLVGWTINGTESSSYEYTMGFGVSARDRAKTTLFGFVFSHFILQNLYFSHIVNREIANLSRYTRSSDDNFSTVIFGHSFSTVIFGLDPNIQRDSRIKSENDNRESTSENDNRESKSENDGERRPLCAFCREGGVLWLIA